MHDRIEPLLNLAVWPSAYGEPPMPFAFRTETSFDPIKPLLPVISILIVCLSCLYELSPRLHPVKERTLHGHCFSTTTFVLNFAACAVRERESNSSFPGDPSVAVFEQMHCTRDATRGPQRPGPPDSSREINRRVGAHESSRRPRSPISSRSDRFR